MNKHWPFILLFLLISSLLAHSQKVMLSGKVVDAHTKEPVPYASVSLTNAVNGKVTDSAGNFDIYASVKDILQVTCVGYKHASVQIKDSLETHLIIVELERGIDIQEAVVKIKINKGLFLWRKIMSKKKQYNRYNLPNFSYDAYNKLEIDIKNFKTANLKKNILTAPIAGIISSVTKPFSFVLDNIDSTSEKDPFLPAYLIETISDYKYQRSPKKYHEYIKASNTKGLNNESFSKLLGVMNQNVNIYSNFVNVMDKDFISPFNDNADLYYNFQVADTQVVNNRKIYRFVFSPKRSGQNTFQGEAWVFGLTWQIQKISLYIGKEANINFIDRVSIFQEFQEMQDSIFFLKRDKFFADFRTMGKQSLTFIGRKTTSYNNISINDTAVTSFFVKQDLPELVETAPMVSQHSDSAWELLRQPDSLTKNERAIYTTVDKLLQMPKFQKLQNTLKFIGTGYKEIGNYEIGPWYNWISANTWEGVRLRFDLGTNTGFNKHIYFHTYLAYGTKDEKVKGLAEGFWILKRDPKRIRIHASYSNDVDNGISSYGEVSQDNFFTLAIRKPNSYQGFLNIQDARFEFFNEIGHGFSTEWFAIHRNYTPLINLPPKASFPIKTGESLNTFEVALKLRFAFLEQFLEGDYFRYSLGTKYPIAELMFVKSIPGVFHSAYDYTKLSLVIKDKTKISPYGTLTWRVFGGKVFGTLPFTFLEIHPGNNLYYYNPNAFNLMNRFEYVSDKYAGINLEHNIGSGLFRFIPFTRKWKFRQFWTVKTLWGSMSEANKQLNSQFFSSLNGSNYTEVGTGIDNILKVFRLDFIWRVSPQPLPAQRSSRFGIFGSFQFQF